MEDKTIKGFSKMRKRDKVKWIVETFFKDPDAVRRELASYWHKSEEQQKVLDGFSENTISNFHMPFSVAPNFLINDKVYAIPMVIEESSVVAAASSAAKYWMSKGGIKATVIGTVKIGQIHFVCHQDEVILRSFFEDCKQALIDTCKPLTKNMEARGGGILGTELIAFPEEPNYYQIRMSFETCDSMGANFINTILEEYAKLFAQKHIDDYGTKSRMQIIMCILSNYTPDCLVRAEVSCPISALGNAVVLATGNDFRAVESCGHTYAARNGSYQSLSHCSLEDDTFKFWLEVPMALGTVGGLTSLHPIAKRSIEMLGSPTAKELMQIVAAVGLAQNFSAIKSLVTTGIQQGHMKMHLSNVLNQLKATEAEFKLAVEHFADKIVSHSAVREFLEGLRRV